MSEKKFDFEKVKNRNQFSIMYYVVKAMRKSGATDKEIINYQIESRSKDYDYFIEVSKNKIDWCNA